MCVVGCVCVVERACVCVCVCAWLWLEQQPCKVSKQPISCQESPSLSLTTFFSFLLLPLQYSPHPISFLQIFHSPFFSKCFTTLPFLTPLYSFHSTPFTLSPFSLTACGPKPKCFSNKAKKSYSLNIVI